ncbi:hypothetical protein IWQ47_005087 [Aquimarina sp. EL_43]|uniref:hypothetical protein n=1 Tax=Aquimarina sp. EL_32 TaxID=2787734 RepID=UPI0018CBE3CA|nr:hypothetical protein [Aquimarina sp. EL_32]MBG6133614.1 hypothetical protein [Aquimarina sp. EL_35]MBG6152384.1 hypothetical protein [Aquimarina sp. EL_32]MBG6171988.1 hypothetical protein [Aquimarina sp. EL_43]
MLNKISNSNKIVLTKTQQKTVIGGKRKQIDPLTNEPVVDLGISQEALLSGRV